MKTYNKPSTSKLATRFDNELKNILMEDLKAFRDKHRFITGNKQAPVQQSLTAAWSIIYIHLWNNKALQMQGFIVLKHIL